MREKEFREASSHASREVYLSLAIGKPPHLAFVAAQHFWIARLPLLAVMQGGANKETPCIS